MSKGFQKCEPNEFGVLQSTYICEAEGCDCEFKITPAPTPVNEYPMYCGGKGCISRTYGSTDGPHAPAYEPWTPSKWSGAASPFAADSPAAT